MKRFFQNFWRRIHPAAKVSDFERVSSELQKNIATFSHEERRRLISQIEQINHDDALRTADVLRNIEAITDLHFLSVIEAIIAKIKSIQRDK